MTVPSSIGRVTPIGRFGVLVVTRDSWEIGQFGHPVHQDGDRSAEIPADILQGDGGIFHCIVKQSRCNHFGRDVQIRQDGRNRQAMVEYRARPNAASAPGGPPPPPGRRAGLARGRQAYNFQVAAPSAFQEGWLL